MGSRLSESATWRFGRARARAQAGRSRDTARRAARDHQAKTLAVRAHTCTARNLTPRPGSMTPSSSSSWRVCARDPRAGSTGKPPLYKEFQIYRSARAGGRSRNVADISAVQHGWQGPDAFMQCIPLGLARRVCLLQVEPGLPGPAQVRVVPGGHQQLRAHDAGRALQDQGRAGPDALLPPLVQVRGAPAARPPAHRRCDAGTETCGTTLPYVAGRASAARAP